MRGKMETLAVFHILKNGGTTLVDRYRLNHSFVYQRVHNEVVYNYKQSNQMCSKVSNLKDYDVRMIFGHGVNFGLSYVLQNNVKYATILRDPVDRIMSAYNYFRLEMITVHNHITDIDFTTWIINCSRMLPTPVYNQYQQFSGQHCLRIDYGRKIDEEQERMSYEQALASVDRLSHVFFIEDNYIEKFDKLAEEYKLKPDTSVRHTHNTKTSLLKHGLEYKTADSLEPHEEQLLLDTVAKDIEFYNYCKGKFV